MIIGCPGAGKSTFGRELAKITGLPLYHLDLIWHRADRTTVSREEFDMRLSEIMKQEKWIIDGNYKRTLPVRLKEADTVFFLDYPLEVCLEGAINRLGKEREDIPWRIDTVLNEDFRQWILDYPQQQIPVIMQHLESYSGTLYIFKSRKDADKFLQELAHIQNVS